MPTLVTGAAGFLGRHLLVLLRERAERVRALVRNPADAEPLRRLGVEVAFGDVLDVESVRSACEGCGLVYHLAGRVSHRRRDRELLYATNVEGVRNVLAALEPAARLVHVSSVAAVGPASGPHRPADERHTFPRFAERYPYAASKRAGEELVLAAAARGADAVVANPGFLLGPGDVDRVSTWHVERYLAGRLRFTAPGGLSNVDARDVAVGIVALAERGRAGERYILTSRDGNSATESSSGGWRRRPGSGAGCCRSRGTSPCSPARSRSRRCTATRSRRPATGGSTTRRRRSASSDSRPGRSTRRSPIRRPRTSSSSAPDGGGEARSGRGSPSASSRSR